MDGMVIAVDHPMICLRSTACFNRLLPLFQHLFPWAYDFVSLCSDSPLTSDVKTLNIHVSRGSQGSLFRTAVSVCIHH
ncbi:hypothetical protein PAXRUDRAFT_823399 [Paxillus rubicundulus Ve08.2h10]|uniref:Uncharacterized protein n=1 Tax=Paxillus rubicundulus Ve08.2h10 TaxID=930991 RepID=A0A0D0E8V6_9AGAM|nr:hypothetical protein PAXRUDRAFT_823399 [Paxillus rubicundulus Ve08.2h10]